MTEYLRRVFGQLVTAVLGYATRVARLTALRELLQESAAALDEAAHLEAKGHAQLARFLRAQIDKTLGDEPAPDTPQSPPALNGESNQPPFALPRPSEAAVSRPEGEGSPPPPRRRRRSAGKNGANPTPAQQAPPQEPAAPPSDPSPSANHHLSHGANPWEENA